MKKIILINTLLTLLAIQLKGQSSIFNRIDRNIVIEKYSVLANYDTAYAHEIIIELKDTLQFNGVQLKFYEKKINGFETMSTQNFNKPSANVLSCLTPFCIYRKNSTKWVIYLGEYSLLKQYRIELKFKTTNEFWNNEF